MSELPKLHVADGSDPNIELLLKNCHYQASDISDADFIIYPLLVRNEMDVRGTISRVSKQYRSQNKKVIMFVLSDYEGTYPFHENLHLLRTSALTDKLAANEQILPYLWECQHEPFAPAPPTPLPNISFCG